MSRTKYDPSKHGPQSFLAASGLPSPEVWVKVSEQERQAVEQNFRSLLADKSSQAAQILQVLYAAKPSCAPEIVMALCGAAILLLGTMPELFGIQGPMLIPTTPIGAGFLVFAGIILIIKPSGEEEVKYLPVLPVGISDPSKFSILDELEQYPSAKVYHEQVKNTGRKMTYLDIIYMQQIADKDAESAADLRNVTG